MAISIEQTDTRRVGTTIVSGTPAKGEFRCVECGYGVAVHTILPSCPMCRGEAWEPALWRPFTRVSAQSSSVEGGAF